jgi:hypothetical protein
LILTGLLASFGLLPATPSAAGSRAVVRVPSEVSVDAPSPDESRRRQRRLREWLDSETPPGIEASPIRIRLTPEERHDLESTDDSDDGRIRVGVVKHLGHGVVFGDADAASLSANPRRVGGGLLRAADDGGFVWAAALESDGASALRVHITNLDLPPNAGLYFFAGGEAFGPYTGKGPDGSGELWSNTVMDGAGVILLRFSGRSGAADLRAISFVIDDVGYLGPRFGAQLTPVPEAFCAPNAPCIENATCYSGTPADAAKNAVALMQWVAGRWLYACSGGLIADTDPSTQIPYFLSANHCISSNRDAQNAEFYFQYQAACGVTMCPDKTGFPRTLGATLKATGKTGDYSLLRLNQNPPGGSVFLGWNNQAVAFTDGADLYRVSHPQASPQALSEHRVDVSAVTCSGWPRGSWIYSRDVVGATEGGSSGSPVVNAAGEIVGQLSGGCGFNISDTCDSASNATVDGAFASYFAQVAPFLAPSSASENCTDGIDNDGDGAADCADPDCAANPACATCSPAGSNCTADATCCSRKCRGPSGHLTCR